MVQSARHGSSGSLLKTRKAPLWSFSSFKLPPLCARQLGFHWPLQRPQAAFTGIGSAIRCGTAQRQFNSPLRICSASQISSSHHVGGFGKFCYKPHVWYTGKIQPGEVAERFKAHAWKACVQETVPRVRIPPSPPFFSPVSVPACLISRSQSLPALLPVTVNLSKAQSSSVVNLSKSGHQFPPDAAFWFPRRNGENLWYAP